MGRGAWVGRLGWRRECVQQAKKKKDMRASGGVQRLANPGNGGGCDALAYELAGKGPFAAWFTARLRL